MTYSTTNSIQEIGPCRIEISHFHPEGGANEVQLMLHATAITSDFSSQLYALLDAYYTLLENNLKGYQATFKRFFLSDAANQQRMLQAALPDNMVCATSMIQQPPLDGSKIALWVYLIEGAVTRTLPEGLSECLHGAYRHLWGGGATNQAANAEYQMRLLFKEYIMQLMTQGGRLADHCIRTWIFVHDVDSNYAGVVKARNEIFATQNLTPQTHFIASTGINGSAAESVSKVTFDSYAVLGLVPEQIQHLYAPTHLNPTYEYGVSFERGSSVSYGDRRHVFISGTASINNKGEVVWPGDIRKQTERMCENVEALLAEADCTFDDVQQMIVYLRDPSDYILVQSLFEARFPHHPKVFLWAPVCRPGWLIEMECIAMKSISDHRFPNF